MQLRSTIAVLAAAATLSATGAAIAGNSGSTTPASPVGARDMGETTHAAAARTRVRLAVTKDAKMGYNLRVVTRDFTWAPQNASSKHKMGEGHAHLYIDGKKITRLYGEWYYLGTLAAGRHNVRVTLNGNDHSDYVHGAKVVQSNATVVVPAM